MIFLAVDDRVAIRFISVVMGDGDTLELQDSRDRMAFKAYPDIPIDIPLFSRSHSLDNSLSH